MMKTILALSVAASLALFTTGCGGGSSNNNTQQVQEDTTPPAFTNSTTTFHVLEENNSTIALEATDTSTPVTFSIPATPHFALSGAQLTFSAPAYEENATNEYNVTVTATDAKNNSATKDFSFIVDPKKASNVIVSTGDKNLTVEGNKIIGPAGLEWLNDDADIMTYDDAVQYCQSADNGSGYRVARRDEILNLMNYDDPRTTATGKRALEDEFANTKSVSWAAKVDDTFFSVNLNSGADGVVSDINVTNGTATYSVLCVKGRSADPHTFRVDDNNASVVIDEATQMAWTKVASDNDAERRAIDPTQADPAAGVNPQSAADYCPTGYRLPNIVELRSLVNYATNSVNSDIVPPVANKTVIVWSDTEDKTDASGETKYFHINATEKGVISTDPVGTPYFITCVKAAQ